jgi:lipoprotein-anchoring transpeptidase ErfK/SrfK
VWLIGAHGGVERTYLVSGRAGTPRPGFYRVWSRSARAWAGHDNITMNLMVRFAKSSRGGNIGFHTIPRQGNRPLQTEAQLGTFRSAGCVRQAQADAEAMWEFAGLGTPVVVI